ncbi:MAG: S-layer homology domain-containing protein [Bacillota bacterium]
MKRALAWLVLAVLLATSTAAPAIEARKNGVFRDLGKEWEWARSSIERMYEKGVLKGYPGGWFKPGKPVTGLEAVIMTLRAMGWEDENMADSKLFWKDYYLDLAVEKGILKPEELNGFNPNQPAKRCEIAKYIVRALGLEEEAKKHMDEKLAFKDARAIPEDAVGYVYVMVDLGLMKGYPGGVFQPNKPASRAEMAVILSGLDRQKAADTAKGIIVGVDRERKTVSLFPFDEAKTGYVGVLKESDIEGRHLELETGDGRFVLVGELESLEDYLGEKILILGELKEGVSIFMRGPLLEVDRWVVLTDRNTLTFEITGETYIKMEGERAELSDLKEGSYVEVVSRGDKALVIKGIKQ